ncbi:MAG: type I-B CRISPR-associated protein Cas8b1/Cst1 [Oscillospiraceae bacterium]|nr:type I-B CRISPR-associated protein Cas8b1/Cst1 [Oscillospiraceae bacterium]
MKIKLFLGDWFVNLGIVGFNRIIEHGKKELGIDTEKFGYAIKNDYIEFDHKLLENFHEYYFSYHFYKTNRAKYDEDRLKKLKDAFSKNPKDYSKYIKNIVTDKRKKFEKIDEENAAKLKTIEDEISKLKSTEDKETLGTLIDKFNIINKTEVVNEKITANYYKSILSDSFFGQPSFINVAASNKTLEEQKEMMYRDYISNIICEYEIYEALESSDKDKLMSLEKKYSKEKVKTLNYIIKSAKKLDKKNYLDKIPEVIENSFECAMGFGYENRNKSYDLYYTDSDFIPLAIPSDTMNSFWNFNGLLPISNLARLILFCSYAGSTEIYKSYLNSDINTVGFKDLKYYSFVNYDKSMHELTKYNNNFAQKADKENPYESLILDIIEEEKDKSEWQLQNILFVEFNMQYLPKKCKMNYFNIPIPVARLFALKSPECIKYLEIIKDMDFKMELIDNLLKNNDLYITIENKLRYICRKELKNTLYCLFALKIQVALNYIKKVGRDLEKIKGKLSFTDNIYYSAKSLRNKLLGSEQGNKIRGIAYRLLNSTKTGDVDEFMNSVIRVYMSNDILIPKGILSAKTNEGLKFEDVSYAFICGLLGDDGKKEDENSDEKKGGQ